MHRFDDATSMPWANGSGVTRQILRSHDDNGGYDWRISLADVGEDGPFSLLPGVDRTIVLCEGRRMLLTVGGESVELDTHVPYEFSGDSDTSCEIPDGPTRDLNIMTNRATTVAHVGVDVVTVDRALTFAAEPFDLVLVALTTGLTSTAGPFDAPLQLMRFDAVHAHGAGAMTVTGRGTLLSARFRPQSVTQGEG